MSEQSNQRQIRLLLLDDHLLFRESLGRLLSAEPGFELVAEFTTASEALKGIRRSGVDVILVDIGIAAEFISNARKARFPGKFLAMAREVDATGSAIVLRLGASGIFLDSDSSAWLVQAIRLVANGEAWVDHKVMQLLAERYSHHEDRCFGVLTERERTVLRGVIDGLSNRRIGARIGVSESIIKSTLRRSFKKASVRTRSQLVRIALETSPASGLHANPEILAY
jgi:two-component system, NarL family, nitrate/nitrite response regulator NarL